LLVFPPPEHVTLAVPAATPVTTPKELTVALDVLLLTHVNVGHVIVLLPWSLHVAFNGVVLPTATDAEDGVIVIDVRVGGVYEAVNTSIANASPETLCQLHVDDRYAALSVAEVYDLDSSILSLLAPDV